MYAHRTVLASKSTYFRAQLEQLTADGSPISTLTLDLSMIKSAVQVFQALLIYLYTEEIQIDVENVQSVSSRNPISKQRCLIWNDEKFSRNPYSYAHGLRYQSVSHFSTLSFS